MNLRQLEIFCAMMRCRTTVAAAYELGVSQSAVSNAIRHLEDQIALRLFEQVGNRLVPTVEAKALYRNAEPLQAMSYAIMEKVRDLRDTKHGHLRIFSTQALARTVVAEALRRFMEDRPNVKIFFDVRRMEGVVESVESEFVDLGLALAPAHRPGMEIVPLIKGRMVVALPHRHPLAVKDVLTAPDLSPHSIIGLERASRLGSLIRQAFDDAEAPYQPTIDVRHGAIACSLVEKGLGLAVVDEFSAGPNGKWNFEVRPFTPTLAVAASVMYLRDRPLSRLASRFVNEVRNLPLASALG